MFVMLSTGSICYVTFFLLKQCAALKTIKPQASSQNPTVWFVDDVWDEENEMFANMSAPNVTYDHMPKAGGTFLQYLFAAALPVGSFKRITEFQGLDGEDRDSFFTIGSVRNPCDQYVSLWSYGADGNGELRDKYMPRSSTYDTTAAKDSPDDIAKFQQWLGDISVPGSIGTVSIRLASSYGNKTELTDKKLSGPASAYDSATLQEAESVMANLNPESVDCWVYTESLVKDAKECLKQWEAKNANGQKVNWQAFKKGVKSYEENPSDHASCSNYFDRESKRLVKQMDRYAFEKFGYDTCCGDRGNKA